MAKKIETAEEKHICTECGGSSGFYKSNSDLFAKSGIIPLCKDCLNRRFEFYKIKYHDEKLAFQRLCMALDIYYNESAYKSASESGKNVIGNYLRQMNMNQNRSKTFDTTLEEGFLFNSNQGLVAIQKSEPNSTDGGISAGLDPELVRKWGEGLSPADYLDLEKHSEYLHKQNPHCDGNQEIFIEELCYTKMQQLRAVRENDADTYNKMSDSYRKSFAASGLKAVKDVDSTAEDTWGAWVERIEQYTPGEYYKARELFKDSDGLGDYFNRHVLRPLRNLIHGTSESDPEFCVKDDGDPDDPAD